MLRNPSVIPTGGFLRNGQWTMYNGKWIMAEHFRELSVLGKHMGAATSRSFCAFLTVLSSFGRTIFCPSFCWLAKVIHFMRAHFSLLFHHHLSAIDDVHAALWICQSLPLQVV